MTLHAQTELTIPEETIRMARAAYPHGNMLMKIRDELAAIYQDQAFASLFPHNGRAVEAPWRLALITVLQFMEELPDRHAADAVRGRIDWKYLLGLALADPGFDASVLCEFRQRLVEGSAEHLLFDTLLDLCKQRGWLKVRERQRTDSTHVLAKIRAINRLMCVGEAMRFALNSLASVAPDWLLSFSEAQWVERYGHRIEESRLPKSEAGRLALAQQIGADGQKVLTACFETPHLDWLRELPAIQVLRRIWVQNYFFEEDGQLRWREAENLPPATVFINSPYETASPSGQKAHDLVDRVESPFHRNLRANAPPPHHACRHNPCAQNRRGDDRTDSGRVAPGRSSSRRAFRRCRIGERSGSSQESGALWDRERWSCVC